jgi:hypothetical protein
MGPVYQELNNHPENMALVYVYNPMKGAWKFAEPNFFYINDQQIFRFKSMGYSYFYALPGEYLFSRKLSTVFIPTGERGRTMFTFEKGKIYYIRYTEEHARSEVWSTGTMAGASNIYNPKFELIPPEKAQHEISNTKYLSVRTNELSPAH